MEAAGATLGLSERLATGKLRGAHRCPELADGNVGGKQNAAMRAQPAERDSEGVRRGVNLVRRDNRSALELPRRDQRLGSGAHSTDGQEACGTIGTEGGGARGSVRHTRHGQGHRTGSVPS